MSQKNDAMTHYANVQYLHKCKNLKSAMHHLRCNI